MALSVIALIPGAMDAGLVNPNGSKRKAYKQFKRSAKHFDR